MRQVYKCRKENKGGMMNAEEIARKLASGWYADETDGEEKELLTNGLATQIERALIAYVETANAELKCRADKLAEALRESLELCNAVDKAKDEESSLFVEHDPKCIVCKRVRIVRKKSNAALRKWEQTK